MAVEPFSSTYMYLWAGIGGAQSRFILPTLPQSVRPLGYNENVYLLGCTTRLKLLQGTPYSTYHILVKFRRLGSITGNKYPNHELIVLSRLPAGCRNYLQAILSKINVNRQEIWKKTVHKLRPSTLENSTTPICWNQPRSNPWVSSKNILEGFILGFVLDLTKTLLGNRERLRCTGRNWKSFHLRNCCCTISSEIRFCWFWDFINNVGIFMNILLKRCHLNFCSVWMQLYWLHVHEAIAVSKQESIPVGCVPTEWPSNQQGWAVTE